MATYFCRIKPLYTTEHVGQLSVTGEYMKTLKHTRDYDQERPQLQITEQP